MPRRMGGLESHPLLMGKGGWRGVCTSAADGVHGAVTSVCRLSKLIVLVNMIDNASDGSRALRFEPWPCPAVPPQNTQP